MLQGAAVGERQYEGQQLDDQHEQENRSIVAEVWQKPRDHTGNAAGFLRMKASNEG